MAKSAEPPDDGNERFVIGNLEYTRREGRAASGNSYSPRLLRCPLEWCGKEFDRDGGRQRRAHFLYDHTPEDFGL